MARLEWNKIWEDNRVGESTDKDLYVFESGRYSVVIVSK